MTTLRRLSIERIQQPKYRTIVVDPPWAYNDKLGSGNSGFGAKNVSNGADAKYRTATVADIAKIPVGEWAEDNAHMYLWTTNAFMDEAFDLMRAWDFKQKTILTWVKHREDQAWLGMGFYFRNATEHCLFGVRGKLRLARTDVSTVFYAPRGPHSQKPDAFYDLVETCSPEPRIDVFARRKRLSGWDVYGDEVYSDIPLVGVR